MSIPKLELEWAARVLHTLVTDSIGRLERGAKMRDLMLEEIKAGKSPSGYRPEWIRNSALNVIEHLKGLASEFNTTHTADQCSSNDLMDVLATALTYMRKSALELQREQANDASPAEDPPKSQA